MNTFLTGRGGGTEADKEAAGERVGKSMEPWRGKSVFLVHRDVTVTHGSAGTGDQRESRRQACFLAGVEPCLKRKM